jgi:Mlc titration factor MtfA (ptsG expression regulator)
MFFRWLRSRRRRQLQSLPFPGDWEEILSTNVAHYRRVDEPLRSRLRGLIQVFVAEKHWEGLDGLAVTSEMQVIISALACLLVAGRPQELDFDHVQSILIYPDVFHARVSQPNRAGVVTDGREARLGEAWYRGPVILSWEDVLADARQLDRGFNVVLHEFAHQLDMIGGRVVDGTPLLRNRAEYDRWVRVMTAEYERLIDRCRHRRPGVLDCYGTKDPGEFFAVATEAYFERPVALRIHSPEMYDVLSDFFGLDPAEWGKAAVGGRRSEIGDRSSEAGAMGQPNDPTPEP